MQSRLPVRAREAPSHFRGARPWAPTRQIVHRTNGNTDRWSRYPDNRWKAMYAFRGLAEGPDEFGHAPVHSVGEREMCLETRRAELQRQRIDDRLQGRLVACGRHEPCRMQRAHRPTLAATSVRKKRLTPNMNAIDGIYGKGAITGTTWARLPVCALLAGSVTMLSLEISKSTIVAAIAFIHGCGR